MLKDVVFDCCLIGDNDVCLAVDLCLRLIRVNNVAKKVYKLKIMQDYNRFCLLDYENPEN